MSIIQVDIDLQKQLTIFTVTSKITGDEIINVVEEYYSGNLTTCLLWDLRAADMSSLSSNELKNILFLSKKYAHRRKNGKTAIVVSSDLSFGISRMYGSYSEIYEHPAAHRITKDYDDAIKWLLEKEKP